MNKPTVLHDVAQHKFFIEFPEGEAVLHYKQIDEKTVDYYSTYVPPALRGKNVAATLVQAGLDYAKQQGYEVIPSCSYVKLYMDKHPAP